MASGFDRFVRWSYERLCLTQPHVKVEGLYRSGDKFKILVPELSTVKSDDGKVLIEWFQENKAMTSPVSLVDKVSDIDEKYSARSALEMASLAGEPLTINGVYGQVNIRVGTSFPRFVLKDIPPYKGLVIVDRELTEEEKQRLESVLNELQLPMKWEIEVGILPENKGVVPTDAITLVNSRSRYLENFPASVKQFIERDEQLWVEDGRKVLSGEDISSTRIGGIAEGIRKKDSSLINATTFKPDDIRNHISLFSETNVLMPLSGHENDAFAGLGITENEFLGLIQMGRLRVLLPLSVHRYSSSLLAKIIEVNPSSVIAPRTIATCVFDNARKRFPYIFPSGTLEERVSFLKALLEIRENMPSGVFRSPIDSLISFHKNNWHTLEYTMNHRGMFAMQTHGPEIFISELFKGWIGQDQALEFGYAGVGVGLASTFSSTYFPVEGSGWSDQGHSALLAHIYNRGVGSFLHDSNKRMIEVLDGLLSIRKDVSVIDLAKSLGEGDIARLKKHVFNLAHRDDVSVDELREVVGSINKEIESIEKRKDRLAHWKIFGPAVGVLSAAATSNSIAGILVGAAADGLKGELERVRPKYAAISATLDSLESIWHRTTPDRVLFARVREEIRKAT